MYNISISHSDPWYSVTHSPLKRLTSAHIFIILLKLDSYFYSVSFPYIPHSNHHRPTPIKLQRILIPPTKLVELSWWCRTQMQYKGLWWFKKRKRMKKLTRIYSGAYKNTGIRKTLRKKRQWTSNQLRRLGGLNIWRSEETTGKPRD